MQTTSTPRKKNSRVSWPVKLLAVATLAVTIASVSIPNLLRSRVAANEASAVGSIRTLNTSLVTYASQHPNEGYPQKLSDLNGLIDPVLAGGVKSGYRFQYQPQPPDIDGAVKSFRITAVPVTARQSGTRNFPSNESGVINYQVGAGPAQPLDGGAPQQSERTTPEQRRILRKASMNLVVADPASAAEQVRTIASRAGGYVESVRLSDEGSGAKQVSIAIRVPSARVDDARRQVRALGQRVRNEEDDALDVTGQYVDLQSNLRNFHAEEAQYLDIMQRSGSIKDTLAVAERLADVRGRIERTQGQLNLLAHQTEMTLLDVTLAVEAIAQPVDLHWHPRAEIKAAFWDAADDLSTYANFLIAVIFRLPVFGLWAFTALVSALLGWRLLRWIRKIFVPPSTSAA